MGGTAMPYRRLNTGDLVARIIAGITDGRGLIPLVGSGLSVESGIPTGQGLQPYLEHVLYRCLNDGLDLDRTGWPPLTDAPAAPAVWPAPGKEAPLAQEAARARGRWNDSLGLLSRLERRADGQPWLGKPDSKVIDSFGHLLTRDARSNFGHAMLAQLARAGRIRTVLTTNFDDLLEDAFRRVRLELEVYDITTSGSLPDHRMVAASPALIKLHGTRVGIRADHTLDHAPDRSDVYTFASYLCGARFDPDSAIFHWSSLRKPQARGAAGNAGRRRAPRRLAPPEPLTLTRDLLVLGFGGRDLRIMQLVVHAINVIMSQRVLQRVLSRADAPTRRPLAAIPRVHWICHTQSDVDKLQETLDELGASPTLQRCFWVTVEDAQVLLHELYTTLTGTVLTP